MKNLPFCVMLIALSVGIPVSTSAKEVAAKGVTTLYAGAGDHQVRVNIRADQFDIGKPSDGIPTVRKNSCTYSRYPCSLVQDIEIFVGSAKIFVPRSSYADLSDLSSARIISKKGTMVLVLNGGDASESYAVKLFFNDEHIYRRLLYPSGVGSEPTEDTKYKLVDIN